MNISDVKIREVNKNDLLSLEWDGEYRHFRRLYAEIYQSACNGKGVMWMADLPGWGLVGQLFVQLISSRSELADGKERGYIYGFRIKPEFRRQGLGSLMMAVAERDLRRRQFRWVTLNVGRENIDARRLYENLGYQVVALEPGKWSYIDHQGNRRDVHEPAWRMEKNLQNEASSVNI